MKPGSFLFIATFAALLALVADSSGLAQASGSADATTTISVTSRLLLLDLVVTDASGAVVPRLTKDDFQVYEDGQRKTVRSFEGWTERPATPVAPTLDRMGHAHWGDARLTILVLDDLNTPFEEKAYSAFMLKRYLQEQPATLSSPSMLLLVNDRGLHPLSGYTRDRDVLVKSVDKRPKEAPSRLGRNANEELLAESFAALHQIALSVEGTSQHKNVVWLGRGFPSLDTTALQEPDSTKIQNAIQTTVTLLRDARITLYKVDPMTQDALSPPTDLNTAIAISGSVEGNATLDGPQEDPFAANFNFNAFVVATGGTYFSGRNDLDREISDGLDRGDRFYTLSYVPGDAPSGYHSIKVKMRNPALHVVTREGYYDAPAMVGTVVKKDVSTDLQLAAVSRMSYDGISLKIVDAKVSQDAAHLTARFAIENRTLKWTATGNGSAFSARIRVMLVALDADRRIRNSASASLDVSAASGAEAAGGVLRTDQSVAIDKDTRTVRLLVEDTNGHIGSTEVDASTWSGSAQRR